MQAPVDGVVLAAGESRRMRRPKSLLHVDGQTFRDRAVETLRRAGCRRVYVVVGPDDAGAAGLGHEWIDVVVNQRRGSEQVDSLRAALRRLPPDSAGVLVLPVDVPLVQPETAAAVLTAAAAADGDAADAGTADAGAADAGAVDAGAAGAAGAAGTAAAAIWLPVHNGVAGHPVLIGRALYGELLNDELPGGVRTLIARHPEGLREVPVEDPGILIDIDTPEEYRRFIGAE